MFLIDAHNSMVTPTFVRLPVHPAVHGGGGSGSPDSGGSADSGRSCMPTAFSLSCAHYWALEKSRRVPVACRYLVRRRRPAAVLGSCISAITSTQVRLGPESTPSSPVGMLSACLVQDCGQAAASSYRGAIAMRSVHAAHGAHQYPHRRRRRLQAPTHRPPRSAAASSLAVGCH